MKKMRSQLLVVAKKNPTPLYLYDAAEVKTNLTMFRQAFAKFGLQSKVFYAIKSNPYAGLLKTVVDEGVGLDVSSQCELKLALAARAKKIIYTGPAKTEKDFELILCHHSKITVNLESRRELELLAKMAGAKKITMRCGVRIHTKIQQGWTKFGIPLAELRAFYDAAKRYKSLRFCGVHFHISYNKTPEKYVAMLVELANYFQKNFKPQERENFAYIDIGGGIYPQPFEGVHTWNPNQESYFDNYEKTLDKVLNNKFHPRFKPLVVAPIEKFAQDIVVAWHTKISPLLPRVELYAEPGRFISHSAMHFLLRIIDVKNPQLGITDGGNNMFGWEKYQFFNYVPLFNLSQFDLKNEIPFLTCGSLCTPDDVWGYYIYTKKTPKAGNIILLPFQGAYTYTLAQNFIKEIPPVYDVRFI
ncbi:alanine racemase [Candidatus Gracilibacteria bacterium]|nr:alanine racemase [Candidatus Gracilibacteria bacterium]MCF7856727.1 alanine racemase [Candidatus Gracilibacteria bacterium]MCF7897033.1 alanine racemase [Candidatus Gracilibacteria bacterium]